MLLGLGGALQPRHVRGLRSEINAPVADATFGSLKYSLAAGDFI
jgi:hypothetical protein